MRWPILITAAAVAVASAQQQPAQPTFRTEANYGRVDLYPTANGVPVPDLRQDEVEVLDNGVPQKIDQFERIQIRAAGPQETRVEPNTVRESRAMLEDPRARVFVVFLDTYHVEIGGSHDIRGPLAKMLDSLIGPDDLVGVMTPEMSAGDVAFARKTTTINGFLERYWPWGERDQIISKDPEEEQYRACYSLGRSACGDDDAGIAAEMIYRRRERITLNALHDLVTFLRGVREERKAIIAISDGWLLYRPDERLARPVHCEVPRGTDVTIDPRSGKLTTHDTNEVASMSACDRDRIQLSQIDDDAEFRRLLDEANRANASFYPVDPRGLPVFDTPLVDMTGSGIAPITPPSVDQRMLQGRLTSLRTLAGATDGLAIVNNNDLNAGLQRIVSDLTSYYLLGYYSSAPLDGKFHAISVRVKRPGVQVRARRGYLAATLADVRRTASSAVTDRSPSYTAAGESSAIEAAIAPLGSLARDVPLRLHVVAGWKAGGGAVVLAAGELPRGAWKSGGDADLMLTKGGETVWTAHARVVAGMNSFEVPLAASAAGEYDVRVRARGSDPDAAAINEVVHVTIPEPPQPSGARYVRRGPATANREQPAADLRFRRTDTLRIEWPVSSDVAATARLLDRTGKPIAVPVEVGAVDDQALRWETAQLGLAALAPGDYIIEMISGTERRLAGFRVVP